MQLTDVVRAYINAKNGERPIGRDLAAKTCEHYFECVRVYGQFLERPATIADLESSVITRFLRSLLEDGCSPYTVKNRRTGLLVQWRFAFTQGWAQNFCAGVRAIYCPPLAINGYNFEQMKQLLLFVAAMPGVVRTTGNRRPPSALLGFFFEDRLGSRPENWRHAADRSRAFR
jgi:hypothetical protein